MTTPIDNVPEWRSGGRASASGFNAVLAESRRIRRVVEAIPVREAQFTVWQFRFASMANDHIVCNLWNGATEGTDGYLIAKPQHLRVTNPSGPVATYTSGSARTVSGESQTIFPAYSVDDLIYAMLVANGTGVSVNSEILRWIDLNVDARRWSAVC